MRRCLHIWEGVTSLGGSASTWQREGGITRSRVENWQRLDFFFFRLGGLWVYSVQKKKPVDFCSNSVASPRDSGLPVIFPFPASSPPILCVAETLQQECGPNQASAAGHPSKARGLGMVGCRRLPTNILARSRPGAYICRRHHLCQLAGRGTSSNSSRSCNDTPQFHLPWRCSRPAPGARRPVLGALMTPCQLDLCIFCDGGKQSAQNQSGGPPGYHVPVCQLSRARTAPCRGMLCLGGVPRFPRQVPENISGTFDTHNHRWTRRAQLPSSVSERVSPRGFETHLAGYARNRLTTPPSSLSWQTKLVMDTDTIGLRDKAADVGNQIPR